MHRLAVIFIAGILVACNDSGQQAGDIADECAQNSAIRTESELVYTDLRCGDGDQAEGGSALSVHYVGSLENGTVFDSSRGGEPFRFLLGAGQVIDGWDEGLDGMTVGGVRELRVPPDLAFGRSGAPPSIPPNTILIFEIELIDVQSSG